MIPRTAPADLHLEATLLGEIMLDPSVLLDVAPAVAPADFFGDAHEAVATAIWRLYDDGKPADAGSVHHMLRALGLEPRVGDLTALGALVALAPHSASAPYHAGVVRQMAIRRRLIAALGESLEDCYRPDVATEDLLDSAEARVFAVAGDAAQGSTRPIADFGDEMLARLERRRAGEVMGVPTHLQALDHATDGLPECSLVVLAARPSMGKTALGLNLAEHVALRGGMGVLFVSLEMNGLELAERVVVSMSEIDGQRVKTGYTLDAADMAAVRATLDRLRRGGRFHVDDASGRTVSQIAANARRMKARHNIGLLVIDYIQLVDAGHELRRASRQEQVSYVSRRLKVLAKDLRIPVLALSQLNRGAENREDHRPRLSDLRESGAIEQDADIVLLLHRPDYYDADDKPGMAELILAKNRNGATGKLDLVFRKGLMRFDTYAPDPEDF